MLPLTASLGAPPPYIEFCFQQHNSPPPTHLPSSTASVNHSTSLLTATAHQLTYMLSWPVLLVGHRFPPGLSPGS